MAMVYYNQVDLCSKKEHVGTTQRMVHGNQGFKKKEPTNQSSWHSNNSIQMPVKPYNKKE